MRLPPTGHPGSWVRKGVGLGTSALGLPRTISFRDSIEIQCLKLCFILIL